MKTPASLLLAAMLPLLGGCVATIGNDRSPRSNATLGQQLIDLQRARAAGALTEGEFQQQRARLLAEK